MKQYGIWGLITEPASSVCEFLIRYWMYYCLSKKKKSGSVIMYRIVISFKVAYRRFIEEELPYNQFLDTHWINYLLFNYEFKVNAALLFFSIKSQRNSNNNTLDFIYKYYLLLYHVTKRMLKQFQLKLRGFSIFLLIAVFLMVSSNI